MRLAILSAAAGMLIGTAGIIATPAGAQPRNEAALVIFGDDACPAGNICVRAPESQRYRIPEGLREPARSPSSERWADRAASLDQASASASAPGGVGSCNAASGQGSWTGCWNQMMKEGKAERAQAAATERAQPQ